MRGDYEASNDRHPFQVQYIGADDLCIRNLTTDEVVIRETKVSGAQSKSQWDRLDATALRLARENRSSALAGGAVAQVNAPVQHAEIFGGQEVTHRTAFGVH